jgi:GNAT superfamily N-acetyltransferase
MDVRSLGYRTDLIFPAFDGEIIDRGNYLVVKSPANPTFYWGNFLLFDSPPAEGDYATWRQLFADEIGRPPEVEHQAFGWDTTGPEKGFIQPFLDHGFELDYGTVLTAQRAHFNAESLPGVTFRVLATDEDWLQSVENQVICRDEIFSEAGYRIFRMRQMQRYKEMVMQGLGAWFGAFSGSQLVTDLGIFCNRELGRYQSVQTHPDFRRRGIAGGLVNYAANYAFENLGIETLVILAEAGSPADRLYQSLGFQFTEYAMGVWISDELA